MQSDVPDLASELERKTIESIDRLLERYEEGQISGESLDIGLKTVNAVTRGLVDDAISFGIDGYLIANPEPTLHCYFFASDDSTTQKKVALLYRPGSESYSVINLSTFKVHSVHGDGAADAYQRFMAIKEKYVDHGYKQVSL